MDLSPYRGMTYHGADPLRRLAMEFVESIEGLSDYRGTALDLVCHREAVTLCEETAGHLYGGFTPLEIGYRPGSRPELEKIVAEAVAPGISEREKALALLAWVRDLPERQPPAAEKHSGGTEEEIAAARSANCAHQSMLLAALAQVAGIPSRIVLHYGTPGADGRMLSGHAVNELFVEGSWAYLDNRGKYFEWPDGRLASTLDLVRFPELALNQPPHVHRMVRTVPRPDGRPCCLAESLLFFVGRRVTRLSNYFIRESARYDYRRFGAGEEGRARAERRGGEVTDEYLGRMREAGLLGPVRGVL